MVAGDETTSLEGRADRARLIVHLSPTDAHRTIRSNRVSDEPDPSVPVGRRLQARAYRESGGGHGRDVSDTRRMTSPSAP